MRFQDVGRMRPSTLRRMAGAPYFGDELELHRLDCLASHGNLEHYAAMTALRDSLANEPVLPEPWIKGTDVMALGAPPGPAVGHWKQAAYDAQLEGRCPDRDALLEWLGGEIRRSCGVPLPPRPQ
jgi:poly(A) polymerase